MSRSWWLKTIFLFFLVLASVCVLTPTVMEMVLYPEVATDISNDDSKVAADAKAERNPALPGWYEAVPKFFKGKQLSLGLDLQGGLMLNYSVDIDSAIDEKLASNSASMQSVILKEIAKPVKYELFRDSNTVKFTFDTAQDADFITDKFLYDYPMLKIVSRDNNVVTLGTKEDFIKDVQTSSVQQAVEIIRERIDGLGVAQPSVRVENQTQIVVELPGLSKSGVQAAERLISTTAVLTFKLIAPQEDAIGVFTEFSKNLPAGSRIFIEGGTFYAEDELDPDTGRVIKTGKDYLKEFTLANETHIKNGREVVYEKIDPAERDIDDEKTDKTKKQPTLWRMRLVRTDEDALSGENVEAAYPAQNPDTQMPYVSLKLDKSGGDTFYAITKRHVGDQLAILMDDTLISDPVIRSEIPGGNVSIEMGRGNRAKVMEDVNNLVVSLRSGALPAPIRQESKSLVGPSLGHDSITSGMRSLALGFLLVVCFMCFYYKRSGITASCALLLNILFIMAGMASMGAVLTLPGIAGIVLTVGMAVDSNVIVFERIREELRSGETPRKSVIVGFDKALWTILDSNITTAIAAIVLMNFGSGPVKGFAVTLLLGIIATVYTAFYVTRNIFELKARRSKDTLSI